MATEIYRAAEKLGMGRGTLLTLARETAQDACLRSIDHMHAHDQEQLLTLLAWISIQDAELLARTSRYRSMLIAA